MTTPVKDMPLDTTITQINNIGTEMNKLETQYANLPRTAEGKVDHVARKELRNKMTALETRQNKLKDSITRRMTGEKGNYRETLIKGKETKDLGPWTGSWRQHYGAV